jgi:hypothetical protein
MTLQMVSFQQISRILDVTDALGVNREGVEISLSPESPGAICRLTNGKLAIIVDADQPFDQWLNTLSTQIQQAQNP